MVSPLCLTAGVSAGGVRGVHAGVYEGRKDPRERCGVPIGTLPAFMTYPRVTNPRLLLWSGFTTLPPGDVYHTWSVSAGEAGRGRGITAGVYEGRKDPRGYSGVPIGTLSAFMTYPRVTNPRLLLWSGFTTLTCGRCVPYVERVCRRGRAGGGVSPPACTRVARTLGI